MPRVIVKVLPASSRGVLGALQYNYREQPTVGGRAGVKDRVYAVFGNLPIDRNNILGMARALETAGQGTRAKSLTKRVILSFEKTDDPKAYALWAKSAQPLGEAFLRKFCPNSQAYGFVHVDQANINVHLEVGNRDAMTGKALDWDKSVIRQMNALRWAPPIGGKGGGAGAAASFSAGAGTYLAKQALAHPSRSIDMLVDLIQRNPSADLQRMVIEGEASWYHTKSGRLGVLYAGRRYTVAGINFALRNRGLKTGLDEALKPKSLQRDERGAVTKQNYHDVRLGVGRISLTDYEKVMDNPLIVGSPHQMEEVHNFIRYGTAPTDRPTFELLARVLNTHLKRKLVYKAKEWYGPNKHIVSWLYSLDTPSKPRVSLPAVKLVKRFTDELKPLFPKTDLFEIWLRFVDRLCDSPPFAQPLEF